MFRRCHLLWLLACDRPVQYHPACMDLSVVPGIFSIFPWHKGTDNVLPNHFICCCRFLDRAGEEATYCFRPNSALSLLKASSNRPDLLLSVFFERLTG